MYMLQFLCMICVCTPKSYSSVVQLGSRSTELLQLAIARFTKAHDAGGAVFMSHNLAGARADFLPAVTLVLICFFFRSLSVVVPDACMDMALRQDSPVLARKYMALARTVLFSRRSSTSGSVPHISSQQRRVEDSATSQALMVSVSLNLN